MQRDQIEKLSNGLNGVKFGVCVDVVINVV